MRADPKKAKREAIARQMLEFEALGGKVQQIPEGQREMPEWLHRDCWLKGESVAERNRAFKNRRRRK